VPPILELLEEVGPDIVTVAFDPEGSGPDTHYKVLQAVAEALKAYEKETGRSACQGGGLPQRVVQVPPVGSEPVRADVVHPPGDMDATFDTCFNTQRTASFPSYEMDGPFSKLARKIQVKQFEQVKTFLGEDFFVNNEDHGMRACRGIVYLSEMALPEFYSKSRELRQVAEAF
jgi:glucosamine-6-phosphate deaminase